MYSPARYIEKLVSDNLKDFIENHSDIRNSVSIGLLSGQLKLTNLILKKQEIPIGDSHCLSLDYGVLRQLKVDVPWTQLHSGNVKVDVNEVNVLLNLKMRNVEDILETRHKNVAAKMVISILLCDFTYIIMIYFFSISTH